MNQKQTHPDIIENGFKNHVLKTDPDIFDAVLLGLKKYEIRLNDRDFKVGESLHLRETKNTGEDMYHGAQLIYTGRITQRVISHILKGPVFGLERGWVIMSFV